MAGAGGGAAGAGADGADPAAAGVAAEDDEGTAVDDVAASGAAAVPMQSALGRNTPAAIQNMALVSAVLNAAAAAVDDAAVVEGRRSEADCVVQKFGHDEAESSPRSCALALPCGSVADDAVAVHCGALRSVSGLRCCRCFPVVADCSSVTIAETHWQALATHCWASD